MKSTLSTKAQPTKRQTEKSRAAIRVTQIINRLQANFDGKLENPLTPTQVKSGQILLAKVLPDLSSATVEDVTPEHGRAEDVIAAMNKLITDKLTAAGMDQKEIEAVLHGRPGSKHDYHVTEQTIHDAELKRLDS